MMVPRGKGSGASLVQRVPTTDLCQSHVACGFRIPTPKPPRQRVFQGVRSRVQEAALYFRDAWVILRGSPEPHVGTTGPKSRFCQGAPRLGLAPGLSAFGDGTWRWWGRA